VLLDTAAPLPDHVLLLADIDEPTTFIDGELAPVMISERARLRMMGPRWLAPLRRPVIIITDGGPWLEFFAAHARRLGLRPWHAE